MNHAWLGVDPGKTGAVALLGDDGSVLVEDFSDVYGMAFTLREWMAMCNIVAAGVEKVASRPGQGVVSTFNFGMNVGTWHGLLAANAIALHTPTPRTWQQKYLSKADGPDTKAASLAVARRLYPTADLRFKKHHNRADALLIATWVRDTV